jgi:hypothetical protein
MEAMAVAEEQPIMGNSGPVFEWSPGVTIVDEDEPPILVDDPQEGAHEEAVIEDDDEEGQEEDVIEDDDKETQEEEDVIKNGSEEEDEDIGAVEAAEDDAHDGDYPVPEGAFESFETQHNDVGDARSDDGDANDADKDGKSIAEDLMVMEEAEPAGRSRYNLRPIRQRTYENHFTHRMDNPVSSKSYDDVQFLQQGASVMPSLCEAVEVMMGSGSKTEVLNYVTGFIMTQMRAKAGIKKHGQVVIGALYQEFLQLHDQDVFDGKHARELTKSQKRAALRAISVIKEKRCGKIKGQTVANGRPQKALYTKDETSSPTVSTDALMMSVMIDACENRDVAIADVTGAYLHAFLDDFTLSKLEGESVEIMCSVCEKYRNFVTCENGKKVLYLQLLKSL